MSVTKVVYHRRSGFPCNVSFTSAWVFGEVRLPRTFQASAELIKPFTCRRRLQVRLDCGGFRLTSILYSTFDLHQRSTPTLICLRVKLTADTYSGFG